MSMTEESISEDIALSSVGELVCELTGELLLEELLLEELLAEKLLSGWISVLLTMPCRPRFNG